MSGKKIMLNFFKVMMVLLLCALVYIPYSIIQSVNEMQEPQNLHLNNDEFESRTGIMLTENTVILNIVTVPNSWDSNIDVEISIPVIEYDSFMVQFDEQSRTNKYNEILPDFKSNHIKYDENEIITSFDCTNKDEASHSIFCMKYTDESVYCLIQISY